MPRVAPGQRKRAYRPKTRTGCHTCKIRRVKCDETKPCCYTCTSTGRKCDGYEPNIEAPPESPSASLGASSRPASIGFLGTETERRSFYFFQQKTAPQLSRFFRSDFWQSLLLQAALCEPSIRHVTLALGSLHSNLEQNKDWSVPSYRNGWTDDFALKNYSQAINILAEPPSLESQQAIDVFLICSILFACLEAMQSSYGSAITHIQSGMKILCEVKYNEKTRRHQHDILGASEIPYATIKMLKEMFVRLDHQIIQMLNGQRLEICDSKNHHAQKPEIPTMFSGLSKDRESLVSQWHLASYSTSHTWMNPASRIPPVLTQDGFGQSKSISILARWTSAYDVYLDIQGGNLTDKRRQGTAALRILKELGSTASRLGQTTVDDQRDWDVFCPMFQNIVSLAEDIVELDQKSTIERPAFCIDMALVRPMLKVSCRCRDPIIRRRAISVLQDCGRTEGAWNAFSTSRVAQRVLDIEEAGLQNVTSCEDIPYWARILDLTPVFHPVERKATITYYRPRSKHDLTKQMIKEVIEW